MAYDSCSGRECATAYRLGPRPHLEHRQVMPDELAILVVLLAKPAGAALAGAEAGALYVRRCVCEAGARPPGRHGTAHTNKEHTLCDEQQQQSTSTVQHAGRAQLAPPGGHVTDRWRRELAQHRL